MTVPNAVIQALNTLKLDSSSVDGLAMTESDSLETTEKIRIFHSLPTLASNLGPEDTRDKLIPTLEVLVANAISAGDDEVLLSISQRLVGFSEFVGGEEHAACLLPILEKIVCTVEEIVVVEAACESLVDLISRLPRDVVEDKCNKLILRILNEDNFCANKKAASSLIVACYPQVSQKRQYELKHNLFHIADSDDEAPLVRAAAVQQLVPLAKIIGPPFKSDLFLVLDSLITDNQRVVRAACVGPLVELCSFITDINDYESTARQLIDKLLNDNSRDSRRALASRIADLQEHVARLTSGGGSTSTAAAASSSGTRLKSLDEAMLSLLEDNEAETRRISAMQFRQFCLAAQKETLSETLLPKLREHLLMEREENVKAELIRCAVKLLPVVRREDALPLVQHILAFLNEGSQSKQYVFEHFLDLVSLMPPNEVQLTLIPSLLRLWQDKNWRVRLGIVQSIPQLYPSLPEQCLRETLLAANLAWLRDPSWYVRECACRGLGRLLRACPTAFKDAVNGVSAKLAASVAATICGAASPPPTVAASPTESSPTGAAAASAPVTPTSAAAGAGTSPAAPTTPSATPNSIRAVTSQAASGGLKALAADSNYHFRQIFLTVVHTIWGPGIPDELAFNASGDDPNAGIQSPGIQSIQSVVRAPVTTTQQLTNCQPGPQLPANQLSTCLSLVLQLASEDPIANVRICAVRALLVISKSIEKKVIQKEVLPVLKKISEGDSDIDVRFYAKECEAVLSSM